MTLDEKRAYSRGYSAGQFGRWPLHRPPLPPDEITANIMAAALNLRNVADALCSMIDEDDEFHKQLAPAIDTFDFEMKNLGRWITSFDI